MKPILPLAALALSLAAFAVPAQAAFPVIEATSGATVYAAPFGRGGSLGRVPRGEFVSIDYCVPPRAAWCHIVWDDGPDGWVNGANLRGAAKKKLVTPFLPVWEPGWHD
jgi:uncharacterized protein YraI